MMFKNWITICGLLIFGTFHDQAHAQTETSTRSGDVVDTILERPLFEPDRHPKGTAAGAHEDFHITGIVGKNRNWRAIFKPEQEGGKSRVVSEKEEIGGWTVVTITSKSVLLKCGTETKTVFPVFSKSAPPDLTDKERIDKVHIMSHKRTDPQLAW